MHVNDGVIVYPASIVHFSFEFYPYLVVVITVYICMFFWNMLFTWSSIVIKQCLNVLGECCGRTLTLLC